MAFILMIMRRFSQDNIGLWDKISYSIGILGKNIAHGLICIVILVYSTQVLHLSFSFVTSIFLLSLLVESAFALFVALIFDHIKSRMGKYKLWPALGSVFTIILSILFISMPESTPDLRPSKCHVAILIISINCAIFLVQLPYLALISSFSSNASTRNLIATVPNVANLVGRQFIFFAVLGLLSQSQLLHWHIDTFYSLLTIACCILVFSQGIFILCINNYQRFLASKQVLRYRRIKPSPDQDNSPEHHSDSSFFTIPSAAQRYERIRQVESFIPSDTRRATIPKNLKGSIYSSSKPSGSTSKNLTREQIEAELALNSRAKRFISPETKETLLKSQPQTQSNAQALAVSELTSLEIATNFNANSNVALISDSNPVGNLDSSYTFAEDSTTKSIEYDSASLSLADNINELNIEHTETKHVTAAQNNDGNSTGDSQDKETSITSADQVERASYNSKPNSNASQEGKLQLVKEQETQPSNIEICSCAFTTADNTSIAELQKPSHKLFHQNQSSSKQPSAQGVETSQTLQSAQAAIETTNSHSQLHILSENTAQQDYGVTKDITNAYGQSEANEQGAMTKMVYGVPDYSKQSRTTMSNIADKPIRAQAYTSVAQRTNRSNSVFHNDSSAQCYRAMDRRNTGARFNQSSEETRAQGYRRHTNILSRAKSSEEGIQLSHIFKAFFKNDQLMLMFVIGIIQYANFSLMSSLLFQFFVDQNLSQNPVNILCLLLGMICQIASIMCYPKIAFDSRRAKVWINGNILMCAAFIIQAFLQNINSDFIYLLLPIFFVIFNVGMGLSKVALTSMVADTVDYGEFKISIRNDALVFAYQSVSLRLGLFISGTFFFNSDMSDTVYSSVKSILPVPVDIIFEILIICSLLAVILYIYQQQYKLNGTFYRNILNNLQFLRQNQRHSSNFETSSNVHKNFMLRYSLDIKTVIVKLQANNENEMIQAMVQKLSEVNAITSEHDYMCDLRARLALGPCGIAEGIAIPHAKSSAVKRATVVVATLDQPLDLGALDGKECDLIFLLASPDDGVTHMNLLGRLSLLLNEPNFADKLRNSSSSTELFERLIKCEKNITN